MKKEKKVFGGAEVEVLSLSVDEAKKILEFSKTKEFEAKVPGERQRAQLLKAAHLVLDRELAEIRKLQNQNPWEAGNYPEQVYVDFAGETRGFQFEKVSKTLFDWSAVPRDLLAKLPYLGFSKLRLLIQLCLTKSGKKGELSLLFRKKSQSLRVLLLKLC